MDLDNNSTEFTPPIIYVVNLMMLSSVTPAVHAADEISIAVSEFALEKRARATARSPAATLIAADPTTRTDPGTLSPAGRIPRPRTYSLPNQSCEIRLFNTADTDCYLKAASAPWGSLHSDATLYHRNHCRKCYRCEGTSFALIFANRHILARK